MEELKKENEALKEENYRLRFLINDLQQKVAYYKDTLKEFYAVESKDIVSDETHELAMKLMKKTQDLPLLGRARTVILTAGCKTLGDIIKLEKTAFMSFYHCGPKTIDDIDKVVKLYGLEWGMDVDKIIDEDMKNFLSQKKEVKK